MKNRKSIHIELDLHRWLSYEALSQGISREEIADQILRPMLSRHAEKLSGEPLGRDRQLALNRAKRTHSKPR
jgi:hypothetical protein